MIMCKIDDFIDVTSRYIAELLDLRADICRGKIGHYDIGTC